MTGSDSEMALSQAVRTIIKIQAREVTGSDPEMVLNQVVRTIIKIQAREVTVSGVIQRWLWAKLEGQSSRFKSEK